MSAAKVPDSVRRLGLAAALGAALAAAIVALPAAGESPPDRVLPDLDQVAPYQVKAVAVGRGRRTRFRLAFASAVENVGRAPLVVRARRSSTASPAMVAEQLVNLRGGGQESVPNVGVVRYVESRSHDHWHLLGFDRYELRRAGDFAPVRPDRKTGFCLGNRYPTGGSKRVDADGPVTDEDFGDQRCGVGRRRLLSVVEGIYPGWGDDYPPHLEGQFIDVTGVRAGRYLLVHRVNADRRLLETRYANNAASALIDLRWPRGHSRPPRVGVVRRCARSDRCPAPVRAR